MHASDWTMILIGTHLTLLILGVICGFLIRFWALSLFRDVRTVHMDRLHDHGRIPGVVILRGVSLLEISDDIKRDAIERELVRRRDS